MKAMTEQPKYKDKEWLERKYIEDDLEQGEIGDICGCSGQTISYWIDKLDVKEEYQKESVLREMYIEKEMSCSKISDELGCSDPTILRYLRKFEIETRDSPSQAPPTYQMVSGGYMRSVSCGDNVSMHRLLMTLEYDLEELKGKEVHHKNHIPWDNRLDNLELMDVGEHSSYHTNKGELWKNCPTHKKRQNLDMDLVQSMWEDGCEYSEIADEVNYHEGTIGRIIRDEFQH